MSMTQSTQALFTWPVRIYYEDTDAGGIVYHSRYINFMERARTEWLRANHETSSAQASQGALIIVSSVACRYLKPARLDDALAVTVEIARIGSCIATLKQQVWRDGELLCDGEVDIACISAETMRPRRWLPGMRELLETSG